MSIDTINYISGGKLGDLINVLYVIKGNYEVHNKKGNLYITGDLKWGGDTFAFDVGKTYNELYEIVICQEYINSFKVHTDEPIDINLNSFRNSTLLNTSSWLTTLSNTYSLPLIEKAWIKLPESFYDEKYKDTILIHRSLVRHIPKFMHILQRIIENNKCLFITCDRREYDTFPLKDQVPLDLKESLAEMYTAINSCKFYAGNLSSPLTMANSLFKPVLIEHYESFFYLTKHYEDIFWLTHTGINVIDIEKHITL